MRRGTLLGAICVLLGTLLALAAFSLSALVPWDDADLQPRTALVALHDALAERLAAAQSPDGAALPSLRPNLSGEDLLAALDIPPARAEDEPTGRLAPLSPDPLSLREQLAALPRVDPTALRLDTWGEETGRFRATYHGPSAGSGYSRAIASIEPVHQFEVTRRDYQADLGFLRVPVGVVGLVLLLVGLRWAVRGIFAGYLIRQLLFACFGGTAVLTLLLFAAASLQFVDRFSLLGPGFFLANVPSLLLQTMPYTLAFGILAGVTMVIGRMASDKEDVILQFNGISLRSFAAPLLVVGTLGSVGTYYAVHYGEPEGAYASDKIPFRAVGILLERLPSGAFAFNEERLPFQMAYESREDGVFRGVTVLFTQYDINLRDTERHRPTLMFLANEARIEYSEALGEVRFRLRECLAVRYERWPYELRPRSVYLNELDLRQPIFATDSSGTPPLPSARTADASGAAFDWLPTAPGLSPVSRRVRTMPMERLNEHVAELEQQIADESRRQQLHDAAVQERDGRLRSVRDEQIRTLRRERFDRIRDLVDLPPVPQPWSAEDVAAVMEVAEIPEAERADVRASLMELAAEADEIRQLPIPAAMEAGQYRGMLRWPNRARAETARRWAIAFAPLVFLLLAVPMGLLLRQGNLLVAFSVTVIVVLGCWFVVLGWATRAAQDGVVPAWFVTVGPTVSALLVAGILIARVFRVRLVPRGIRARRRANAMAGLTIREWSPEEELDRRERLAALERALTDSTASQRRVVEASLGHETLRLVKRDRPSQRVDTDGADPSGASSRRSGRRRSDRSGSWRMPAIVSGGMGAVLDRIPYARRVFGVLARLIVGGTFHRYILRSGLISVAAAGVIASSLFITVDYLTNADYFRNQAEDQAAAIQAAQAAGVPDATEMAAPSALTLALEHYLGRLPEMIYLLAPLIVLASLGFVLTRVVRNNELLVLRAGGVPAGYALRPLALLALIAMCVMFLYNEYGRSQADAGNDASSQNAFLDRRNEAANRLIVDRNGHAVWLQWFDSRRAVGSHAMTVRFDGQRPRVMVGEGVWFTPAEGWQTASWRSWSWGPREIEGLTVRTVLPLESDGPLAVSRRDLAYDPPLAVLRGEPIGGAGSGAGEEAAPVADDTPYALPRPAAMMGTPGTQPDAGDGARATEDAAAESGATGDDDGEVAPARDLGLSLRPGDIHRRVTQILAEYSISDLRRLADDRPDWNAPRIVMHRHILYPLGCLILYLFAAPLIVRTARFGGWSGLAISMLVALAFYGLLIALSGWALYLQDVPPAAILYGGTAPLAIGAVYLYARLR